ncbi:unnamed protein product [Somion occarium]|uniref:NAD(P)-binding protein n=1 Tax=Somion occarium TaxID=3059160 RepID=A0ABP1CUE9_9APHY
MARHRSSGFGRRLVNSAVARGDKVIATSRSIEGLEDLSSLSNVRVLQLDVTEGPDIIKQKIDAAVTFFGRIDVLVNNAGIAVKASVEEGGSKDFMDQIQTNVIGLLDVTSAVLPHMRARQSGTIVVIGSRSSWFSENQFTGHYSASKAAVRVLGETLAVEVAPFSIRVLIAEPGPFRTEGMLSLPMSTHNNIPEYDEARERTDQQVKWFDGKQPNDPVKAMEILVDVVRGEGRAAGKPWPLYLPLSIEAEEAIRNKCKVLLNVVDEWKDVIRDTRVE